MNSTMVRRILWAMAGVASTVVGLLGLLIPIIPGILFLLLAAVCFTRAARAPQSKATHEQLSFADEMRRDLHQQYRRLARYNKRPRR